MSNHANHRAKAARRGRGLRFKIIAVVAGVLVVALGLGLVMWLSSGSTPEAEARKNADAIDASQIDLTGLTESTTHTRIDEAPIDDATTEATDGTIVHPVVPTAVFDEPNGDPIAKIGPKQLGDTWLPVIDTEEGWTKILLPSKPNGSTGWLQTDGLKRAVTQYEIRVHLTSMTLELIERGREVGSWTIGIGKSEAPTPVGRTFLLGSIVDPDQPYSPIILPLGTHSATLDTFGGGPGTVAIHTWPTSDVFGTRSSDGCIRVPEDALNRLKAIPLGTLVLVDEE